MKPNDCTGDVKGCEVITLSDKSYDAFVAACEAPPAPNAALMAAQHRRKLKVKQFQMVDWQCTQDPLRLEILVVPSNWDESVAGRESPVFLINVFCEALYEHKEPDVGADNPDDYFGYTDCNILIERVEVCESDETFHHGRLICLDIDMVDNIVDFSEDRVKELVEEQFITLAKKHSLHNGWYYAEDL